MTLLEHNSFSSSLVWAFNIFLKVMRSTPVSNILIESLILKNEEANKARTLDVMLKAESNTTEPTPLNLKYW